MQMVQKGEETSDVDMNQEEKRTKRVKREFQYTNGNPNTTTRGLSATWRAKEENKAAKGRLGATQDKSMASKHHDKPNEAENQQLGATPSAPMRHPRTTSRCLGATKPTPRRCALFLRICP